jgi:tryptophan halogenase
MIRLMQMFPLAGINQSDIDEFNRQTRIDIESIRDFIILHYCVTDRNDSPFWRYCRNMEIPETLAHKIRLFRETGRVFREEGELFAENSWIQVMLGQGITPAQYHPVVDVMEKDELERFLATIKSRVDSAVSKLPTHDSYIDQYCRAPE